MQESLPITVILVTDADTVDALIGLAHIPENPVGGVLYASGLVAHKSMYDLGGTYGAGGSYSQQYPFALTDISEHHLNPYPFVIDEPDCRDLHIDHPAVQPEDLFFDERHRLAPLNQFLDAGTNGNTIIGVDQLQ